MVYFHFKGCDNVKFCSPRKSHISDLILLSQKLTNEYEWGNKIPIGRIDNEEKAKEKLFGDNAHQVVVAQKDDRMIGFIGIYRHEYDDVKIYEASILIDKDNRQKGLGRRMCDEVFKLLSKDIEVVAFVADFNVHSINATPKMGFKLKEKFVEDEYEPCIGSTIYVFTRRGEKEA